MTISSVASRTRGPSYPGYQTSKAGASAFSEMAMYALRGHGVRVTTIEPGEVATPMQTEEDLASMRMLEPADVADAVIYAVTRPRHAQVPELRIIPMP